MMLINRGEILDQMLPRMAPHGRIAACGAVASAFSSQFNILHMVNTDGFVYP
jgi:NADPH-dependent curcumin reductase CurA